MSGTKNIQTMIVRPRSAGGVFPDGSAVLPTIHFEGSRRRKMSPEGAEVPRSAYYMRLLHSRDLEEIDKLPEGTTKPQPKPISRARNSGLDNVVTSAEEG